MGHLCLCLSQMENEQQLVGPYWNDLTKLCRIGRLAPLAPVLVVALEPLRQRELRQRLLDARAPGHAHTPKKRAWTRAREEEERQVQQVQEQGMSVSAHFFKAGSMASSRQQAQLR